MHENICLQCKSVPQGPANRLVLDSCGHKKCRTCLLNDDVKCKQCEGNTLSGKSFRSGYKCDTNGDDSGEVVMNYHTGVIQVNGNVPNSVNGNEVNGKEEFEEIECVLAEGVQTSLVTPASRDSTGQTDTPKLNSRKPANVDIPSHIKVLTEPLAYHCTICDKKFITKTHVKYHAYCTAPKPYKCEVCQKEFILRAQLDVHSYKHKSNKPHMCAICKKSFSDRSKLSRHSAVHSTVRSFICSTCGNAYRSKESLRLHSVTHKSEKPYGCKLCTARFNNLSNLNKHVLTHSQEKSHMCDQCGKRFKQKLSLSVHRKSHLRNRQHQCGICLRAFINNKDLKRHALIHADTKGFACGICSTSFRRKDNLRRHMKNTHPGKSAELVVVMPSPSSSPDRSATLATVTARVSSPAPLESLSAGGRCRPTATVAVDTPNAINVITSASSVVQSDSRAQRTLASPVASGTTDGVIYDGGGQPGGGAIVVPDRGGAYQQDTEHIGPGNATVINGPIKLAFKTPAFKSHYNINRDFNYVPTSQRENSHDMAESIDICQKILSTSSSKASSSRNIIRKTEPTSEEICQKILGQTPTTLPIHYETSFQNRKHAMIKNIKFKVPIQYTRTFQEASDAEEKKIESEGYKSVIVNNNNNNAGGQENSLHWRRRTSQNLGLKHL